MIRSTALFRTGRPARRVSALGAGALLSVAILSSPAGAGDDHDHDDPVDEGVTITHSDLETKVWKGETGSTVSLVEKDVDADLVGKTCEAEVIAANNGSVHPGTNLIIVSGGTQFGPLSDVEAASDQQTDQKVEVVLGETIELILEFGEDGVSSLAGELNFVCTPVEEVPEVEPAGQEAPQEAPPAEPVAATPTYTG